MPLVRELGAAGGFPPVTLAGRDFLGNMPVWLARAAALSLATGGLAALLALGSSTSRLPDLWTGFFYLGLPLWGVLSMGAWRDLLEGGVSQGLPQQLRRWGPRALAALPWLTLHLVLLERVTGALWRQRAPLGLWGIPLTYVLLSLTWGYTVADLVLHRGPPWGAGGRGLARAGRDLVGLPGRLLGWLRRPRLPEGGAGPGLALVLLLAVWASTMVGAAVAMLACVLLHFGVALLGLPQGIMGGAAVLLLSGGSALGFEFGVGCSTYNYLGMLAAAEPGTGGPLEPLDPPEILPEATQ